MVQSLSDELSCCQPLLSPLINGIITLPLKPAVMKHSHNPFASCLAMQPILNSEQAVML